MKIETSISKITNDDMILRGEKFSEIINELNFTDTVFFLLKGEKPNAKESVIFGKMLTCLIDHGAGTNSSTTARFIASSGNTLNTAVGGGVLSIGDFHGGAIENAMKQLLVIKEVEKFVKNKIESKKIIFGYGHKIYKEYDPRVKLLLKICKEQNFKSNHINNALEIETQIEKIKGRKIPINVDGLVAALLLEMNFPPEVGKGIFIIGRVPGLVAQVLEEQKEKKKVRRLDEDDIIYKGN